MARLHMTDTASCCWHVIAVAHLISGTHLALALQSLNPKTVTTPHPGNRSSLHSQPRIWRKHACMMLHQIKAPWSPDALLWSWLQLGSTLKSSTSSQVSQQTPDPRSQTPNPEPRTQTPRKETMRRYSGSAMRPRSSTEQTSAAELAQL